jgi:hypothetical protein
MVQPQVERRTTRRFPLNLPVAVKRSGEGVIFAHTRDVSSRGICFYMSKPASVGEVIEFTLTLTPEITLTEAIRVRCHGRILRIEGTDAPAVAAVIEHYDFLAS